MQDWLTRGAAARPEHPFIRTPDLIHSYAKVDERAWAAAAAIGELGLSPGARVGLIADNSVETVAALFGIWRAGHAAVVLNGRLTTPELEVLMRRAEIGLVIGDAPALGRANLGFGSLDGAKSVNPVDVPAIELVAFTSGSGGVPKGVRLTGSNLEASAAASAIHLDHRQEDVWLANLPLFHIGGLMILFRSAREMATVLLHSGFDATATADALETGQANLASMVAFTLDRTLRVNTNRFDRVKAVLVGGGPVPVDLVAAASGRGLPILASYGLTETASQIATARRAGEMSLAPVHRAEIRVERGVIEVRGPMVTPGYLDQPERSEADWLVTGDLGRIDDDGGLWVTGRADTVIVTGGENVEPEEIESVLRQHPGVEEVVVVGVPDPVYGSVVAAVFEGEAGSGEVERFGRYRLAGFKIPKKWLRVDAVPRNHVGKVDRAGALDLFR